MLEVNFTVNRSVVKKNEMILLQTRVPDEHWTIKPNKHSGPSGHAACVLNSTDVDGKVTE